MKAGRYRFPLLLTVAVAVTAALAPVEPARAGAFDDRDLAASVRARLEGSLHLDLSRLEVRSKDAEVTLAGRVRTVAAAEEAVRQAARVPGVRRVVSRIEISARKADSGSLERRIRARFAEHLALSISGVTVKVRGRGRVVLGGEVKDARMRLAARRVAGEVEGVRAIEDRIETPPAEDELIEKSIATALAREEFEGMRGEIEATSKGGKVTLSGWAPRVWDTLRAADLAWGVNGVRSVDNRIEVRPRETTVPLVRP